MRYVSEIQGFVQLPQDGRNVSTKRKLFVERSTKVFIGDYSR